MKTTATCLLALLPACGRVYAFPESDDVSVDPVRSASGFRSAQAPEEYGDVYVIAAQSAHEVNGWVGAAVDGAARVVHLVQDVPSSSDDGTWRTWGPYRDREGKDVSWLLRLSGDETASTFEAWIGSRGAEGVAEMDRLLQGEIAIDETTRRGSFTLELDAIEAHPDVKDGPNRDRRVQGTVVIEFDRDVETDRKDVTLDFTEFAIEQEIPVPDWFSAERYAFHRAADGSGTFELAITSTFQAEIWSGPERERMEIGVRWHDDASGRAHGEVRESAEEGDLAYGDLTIDECFGGDGLLTWRSIAEAWKVPFPDYDGGEEDACTVAADQLP